jgi:4'-phosphopantetheinyl transferase
MILGRYLQREPERLRFSYSAHGKPSLTREAGDPDLRFNLSHSHELVLYAVTCGREVGVDLEQIRPAVAQEQIAERFFAEREVAALRALAPSLQPPAFFHCWTRKEAYIKARGQGLAIRLDQFEVSLAPGEPAALLAVNGSRLEAARWTLRDLAPGPGYAGAVAAEGQDWQLRCWEWPSEIP